MNVISKSCRLALLAALAFSALASPAAPESNRFAVGLATFVGESPYRGADPRLIPVPVLAYRGPRFQLQGIRASYRLWQHPYCSLSSVAQWRFSAFDANDSPALAGMEDRSATVDAGLRLAGPRFLPLETGIEVRGDTLGVYDGGVAAVDIGWRFVGKQGFLRPGIRLEWLSSRLSNYLYGVRPDESLAERPAYSPDSSLQAGADVLWVRPFANRWEFTALAGMTWLDSEATRSPIVDKSALWRTLMGIGYRF